MARGDKSKLIRQLIDDGVEKNAILAKLLEVFPESKKATLKVLIVGVSKRYAAKKVKKDEVEAPAVEE